VEEEELHTKQVFLRFPSPLPRANAGEGNVCGEVGLLLEDRMVTEAQMVAREDFLEE
jgi:hypothetical protein